MTASPEMLKEIDPERITTHAAIALGLLTVEHVAPLLASRPQLHALVAETVRTSWSWMETREPALGAIYWQSMGPLYEEDSAMREDPLLPVLHCVLFAQTYFFWSAEAIDADENPGAIAGLGNDIAEVDESYLTQCLQYAVKVSPHPERTTQWLNGVIERMERDHPATPADFLGSPLRRADFDIAPIDQ